MAGRVTTYGWLIRRCQVSAVLGVTFASLVLVGSSGCARVRKGSVAEGSISSCEVVGESYSATDPVKLGEHFSEDLPEGWGLPVTVLLKKKLVVTWFDYAGSDAMIVRDTVESMVKNGWSACPSSSEHTASKLIDGVLYVAGIRDQDPDGPVSYQLTISSLNAETQRRLMEEVVKAGEAKVKAELGIDLSKNP